MSINANIVDIAFNQALKAKQRGEVPVGAVITDKYNNIIAANGNRIIELQDPTAHAEILAIREACKKLSNERLNNCNIYVTLEPCSMCATAISLARLNRLYYGAEDLKMGAVDNNSRILFQSSCNHKPQIYGGINEKRASELLKSFFHERRHNN